MTKPDIFPVFQWEPSDIISVLLLGFLFFWGLYMLYQKWARKVEVPLWIDLISLIIMFVILGIEILQFRDWMKEYTLLYILSSLGLFVSATALYAQSFISLVTTIFLSIIQPGEESSPDIPRFGPAEILEHEKDYEGALNEYLVLARIYPYHPSVHIRIANMYLKLNQPRESMDWLKKSLKYLKKDEDVYLIVARYCDIAHDLGELSLESEMIDYYLSKYPNSVYSKSLTARKRQIKEKKTREKDSLLISLEKEPLDITQDDINQKGLDLKKGIQLEKTIEDSSSNNLNNKSHNEPQKSAQKRSSFSELEPL
ncbi:MAG: hypothetical protein LDL53_03440 [Candidatus Hydrogenedens sp.]|nr:hypothetical protein [Candidatus Hydrogenedens sp.]